MKDDVISRKAAIDALKNDERYNEDIPNRADGVRDAIITIANLPAADAVPVVRCKDCQYADSYYHCGFTTFWTTANDYCSKGEKR